MNRQELTYFLAGCCRMKSKGPVLWLKMRRGVLTKESLGSIVQLGKITSKDLAHMDHKQFARDRIILK